MCIRDRAEAPAEENASAAGSAVRSVGEMADAPIATAEAAFAAVSPEPEPAALTEASIPAATLPPASAVELPAAEAEQLALSLGSYIASDPYVDAEKILSIDPLEYGACFSTDKGTWFHVCLLYTSKFAYTWPRWAIPCWAIRCTGRRNRRIPWQAGSFCTRRSSALTIR